MKTTNAKPATRTWVVLLLLCLFQMNALARFVSGQNDAPVLDATVSRSMTVQHDASNPSGTVGSLINPFTTGITDIDDIEGESTGKGIAIVSSDNTNGTWWYSTNAGANWSPLGTPSSSAARLLADNVNTRLYFKPNAGFYGTFVGLTIRAWDQATGVSGGTANTNTNGGATAFSITTDIIQIIVTQPIIFRSAGTARVTSGGSITIGRPAGTVTNDLLVGCITVTPSTAAIISSPSSWILVRRVDNVNASSNSLAIYYHVTGPAEPSSYTWDLTSNSGAVGGIMAFSGTDLTNPIDVEQGQITPISLSHSAPSVTTTVDNAMILSLHSYASSGTWSPPDGMAERIDIMYNVATGASGVSLESNTVLQSTSGATGALTASASNNADVGSCATLALRPQNTAPVLYTNFTPSTIVQEDAGVPSGAVGSLIGAFTTGISDIDAGAAKGIAIVSADQANGTWYYSTNGGVNWIALGSVSGSSARLLADNAGTRLYFQPNANYNGTISSGLTIRAWDQATGTSGSTADVTTNGDATAFSTATDGIDVVINAVNDAPTATNLSAAETYTEDVSLNLIDIVVSDIDNTNVTATLTLSNTSAGSLSTATSGAVTSTYVAGTGVWIASGAIANVNNLLAGVSFIPAPNFNSSFTIATGVFDGSLSSLGSKTMTGIAVNDAPTATNLSAAESYTEDTQLNLTDIVVSDIDNANVSVTLTLSTSSAGSLSTATAGAVTSTYNSGTGVWTANGAIADVNTLLAGVIFTPTANFNSNFSITTSVTDGSLSATGSKAITGTAVNDAPTATNLDAAESYLENTPLNLTDIVVTDVDSQVSATLTLSDPTAGSLSTATSGAATSTYSPGTGVWNASGSVADVNVLLANVTFVPSTSFINSFTIATSVTDGIAAAVTGTKVLTGITSNDPPAATNLDGAETYTEDVTLNLIDIAVSDADNGNITVTLTLSNPSAGSLSSPTSGAATSTYNSGTGVWTVSGAIANVNVILATVTFVPAANFNSSFTIATSVSDGIALPLTGVKSVTGIAVNDAPVLDAGTSLSITVNDDAGFPFGAVGSLVSNFTTGIIDVDAGAVKGIAIVSVNEANGTWYYSLDGGTNWSPVGTVSSLSARLLADNVNTRLYFHPFPGFSGTISSGLTIRAWDQTSGAPGDVVSVIANGGATAFSVATDGIDVNVNEVNDAPLLDAGTFLSITVNEDAGFPVGAVGSLISAFTTGIIDADAGAVKGIAIVSANQANGTWYYSLNGGANWSPVGSVSSASARLLADNANTRLYFQPNANFSGTISSGLTIRAWDQTTGTQGGTANTTINGGTTAFSLATDGIDVIVNAVNDAPVLDATPSLSITISEDAGLPVGAVGSPINNFTGGIIDVDAGAVKGIAIVSANQVNGTWYYSLDGGASWNLLGSLSNASAKSLADNANTRLYFQPVANFNGTISSGLTIRAWDQTSGATGDVVSTTINGGATAFSVATDGIDVIVNAVNDAPVLDLTPALSITVNEDAGFPVGAVGALISNFTTGIIDVDAGAVKGIAIVSANQVNGTWYYSLDGGSNWSPIGSVSSASARLLADNAGTRLYFAPFADLSGIISSGLTIRAWDQTSGASGDVVSTTINGGAIAFSLTTDGIDVIVTPVNDAPVLDATPSLSITISEDAGLPVGAVGSPINNFTGGIIDMDAGAVKGIAIVLANQVNGTWYYSLDGGANWSPVGTVSSLSARLLADNASTRLYFQPFADFSGTISSGLTLRAWDQTSGAPGDVVSTTINGGATAFSVATDGIDVIVTPVNDVWNGTGLWSDGTRWSLGHPPVSENVVIATGTPSLDIDYTVPLNKTLIINNGAGLVINSNKSLSVSGSANFNGQPVVFKSDATGTASLGASSGVINGADNVTVERYLPIANVATGRSWRLLNIPVKSSTKTIRDAWAGHAANGNAPNGETAGSGTLITGQAYANGNTAATAGYDWWAAIANTASSIRRYTITGNSGAWTATPTTTTLLNAAEEGYMLFVRGDRMVTTGSGFTTLRPNGTIRTGTQTYSIPAPATAAYKVMGNPYPATISFETMMSRSTNSSLANSERFWQWDANLGTNGAYRLVTKQGAGSWLRVPAAFSDPNPSHAEYISSSQAFIIETLAAGNNFTIEENDKPATLAGNPPSVFDISNTGRFYANLNIDNGNKLTLADGIMASFDAANNNSVDRSDAAKVDNFNENMSILRNGKQLTLEARKTVDNTDTILLQLRNMQIRNYALQFKAMQLEPGLVAVLQDAYAGKEVNVSTIDNNITTYNFTVSSATGSAATDRFRILFKAGPVLPLTLTNVKAYQQNNGIQVDWKTVNEKGIKNYEVEKSVDGVSFAKTTTVIALGGAENNYGWFDASPFNGDNYYRIKLIGTDGRRSYSPVLRISTLSNQHISTFALYPNPVKGNKVSIQLNNIEKGKYTMSVYNSIGQRVINQMIEHPGGSGAEEIKLGDNLAAGVYRVSLTNGKGSTLNQTLILQR